MNNVKLDIKAKFGVVIALVLASVAIAGWAGLRTINGLDTHNETLYQTDFTGMRLIADLNVNIGHVQDEAVNFALAGDKGENQELLGRDPVIRKELAQLAARPENSAKEKKLLASESAGWTRFMADWRAGKLVQKPGESAGDAAGAIDERISPLKDNMETLAGLANANAKDGFDSGESFAESGRKLTIVALIVAALLGLAGVVWMIKQIVPRVRRYSQFTTQVAEGDLSSRVETGGNDELTQLGQNLNTMVESLAGMSSQVLEGARAISSSASQILATASQQSAGANQQSAAINQTTTATEEIRATAEQTDRKSTRLNSSHQR